MENLSIAPSNVEVNELKFKASENSKNKLKNKLMVLSHDAKRLHNLIEKMLKIIERNEKKIDYYTFVEKEKFTSCFNDIGDKVIFYKDKLNIC